MRSILSLAVSTSLIVLILLSCSYVIPDESKPLEIIAFGSCANQREKQPVLNQVVEEKPDLFIYLGDNIYGDTQNMAILRAKYRRLATKESFVSLRKNVPILAVWDDHDYGKNDAGKEYPKKEESKEIFLNFWKEPKESERRKHPGIYHSHIFGPIGKRTQIILLDTRSFRDHLLEKDHSGNFINDYMPNPSPDSTFLGVEQWEWLKGQLSEPAELRIMASSNQFSHTYNGWESWTNVPNEKQKMLDLIKETGAKGVVFLSGDVHWGEISKQENPGSYPIYDITSSGITETWHSIETNENRVGEPVRVANYGVLRTNWNEEDPEISMEIHNKKGVLLTHHSILLSDLQ